MGEKELIKMLNKIHAEYIVMSIMSYIVFYIGTTLIYKLTKSNKSIVVITVIVCLIVVATVLQILAFNVIYCNSLVKYMSKNCSRNNIDIDISEYSDNFNIKYQSIIFRNKYLILNKNVKFKMIPTDKHCKMLIKSFGLEGFNVVQKVMVKNDKNYFVAVIRIGEEDNNIIINGLK